MHIEPKNIVMMGFLLQGNKSPLIMACFNGHLGILKTLIETEADVHVVNTIDPKLINSE